MRWLTVVLAALLLLVQGDLWLGKGNVPHAMTLRKQLAQQLALNAQARERNARVAAEVADLKEGQEMIEEKARYDLGLVRPNEILVRIDARH